MTRETTARFVVTVLSRESVLHDFCNSHRGTRAPRFHSVLNRVSLFPRPPADPGDNLYRFQEFNVTSVALLGSAVFPKFTGDRGIGNKCLSNATRFSETEPINSSLPGKVYSRHVYTRIVYNGGEAGG